MFVYFSEDIRETESQFSEIDHLRLRPIIETWRKRLEEFEYMDPNPNYTYNFYPGRKLFD